MPKAKTEEAAAVAADHADLAPTHVEHLDDEGPAAPTTVRARVLVQCALGVPNDIVEVAADQVETLAEMIDTDPAAVAYAESQGR